jgi:hypothetical protein
MQGTQGAFRRHNDLPILANFQDFIAIKETWSGGQGYSPYLQKKKDKMMG